MSNLLRNRWLPWSLLVAALVALGVGIHRIQARKHEWRMLNARFLENSLLRPN
jgi:hypothetical protein